VDPNGPTRGDLRMVTAQKVVPANFYAGYAGGADGPGYDSPDATIVHSLRNGDGGTLTGGKYHADLFDGRSGTPKSSSGNPIAARGSKVAAMTSGLLGDWDNGPGGFQDGCYVNKPDDFYGSGPNGDWWAAPIVTPNRQVHSPVVFGSLPVGSAMNPIEPWRTLLFCPNPAAGAAHPGFAKPHDHAFLDFFTMPVVEPYAISEPFSTAGKINLNYEIAPFSYIRRATGLHGILKAEEPLILPNEAAKIYKLWDHETNDHPFKLPNDPGNKVQDPAVKADWDKAYRGVAPFDRMRRAIDPAKTLAQADTRFAAGDIFRSATEICELHLVRQGETLADYTSDAIWPKALITGDNTRERPYTNLYAKLTTRSNTFTVHVRAQVLRQSGGSGGTEWAVWREGRDQQIAEHRGSTTIERYIDPSDPALSVASKDADFATNPDLTADNFFRFRIVATKKFVP
jgi:uncharacterized protein (TIGR02600 family)